MFKHGPPPTATDELDMTVDRGEEGVVVRLHGRLGIDSSPALRHLLLALLQQESPKTIIVDLSQVVYMDASGLATLLEALKIARTRQIMFCVNGIQGRIVPLFEATGLMNLFETNGCRSAASELKVS